MHGEPKMVNLTSGGLRLHARVRDCDVDAPTLVLLSGLGFHTFEYEPLSVELAGHGFNTLSLDYRGHGRSEGRRGVWVLDDLVADTRAALDLAGGRWRGPTGLFGNSLGAMVALRTGAVDQRVVGVAAANAPASLADFLLTRPRRALLVLAKLVAPLVPMRISVNHFYSYGDLIDDPSWVRTIEADRLIAAARRLAVPTYTSLLEEWDGTVAVRRLRKPVLLMQGRNDRMQPPSEAELLFEAANEPKAYVLLDTGHLPHLEDPGGLADALTGWFSGLRGRDASCARGWEI